MGDHKHVCLRNGTQQPQPSLLSTARARAALESERHGRLVEPTSVEMQGHGIELEPKGPDELASRDVPAFPREERHHREPVGTRRRRLCIEATERKGLEKERATAPEGGGALNFSDSF